MMSSPETERWMRLLKEYSARNAGRRAHLQSDDPVVNAQWAEIAFPLRGITYDDREDRVEILLGETNGLESRMTHSIECPTAIDLARARDPGDDGLRIRHGAGQTLVRFV